MADELDDILRMATETEVAERRLNAAIADTATGLQKMLAAGTIGQQQFAAATVDLGQKLKAVFAEQSAGHQKFIQQQLEAKKSLFGTVDATAAIAKGAVAAYAAQTKFNAAVAETAKKLQAMLASGKITQTQYNIATRDLGKNVKVVLDRQEELTKATKTGFVGALQGVRAAIGEVTSNFFTAQGAIQSMMAVTSPAAYETFTGSLEMLTRQIGMAFIPEVTKVSFWLQDLANWVRNMDEGVKDSIVGWATWALEIGGVVAGFVTATKVVSMLISPVWILKDALMALYTAWKYLAVVQGALLGPWWALAAVIGAVAAALGLAYLGARNLGDAMDDLGRTAALGKAHGGGELTEKELRSTLTEGERDALDKARAEGGEQGYQAEAAKRAKYITEGQAAIEQLGPERMAAKARQAAAKLRTSPEAKGEEGERQRLEALDAAGLRTGGGGPQRSSAEYWALRAIGERATGEKEVGGVGAINTGKSNAEMADKLEKVADEFEKSKQVSGAQAGSLQKIAAGQKPGAAPQHIQSFQKEMQVQATAIDQARMTFQTQALKDPMEAQRLEDQRKANQAAIDAAKSLDNIDKKIQVPPGISTNANRGGMPGQKP